MFNRRVNTRKTMTLFAALTIGLGAATTMARPLVDRDIADAIDDELFVDPAVVSHRIDVSVDKGIVTLSGQARSLLAKRRAEMIAETIKGVRAVVNTIKVSDNGRTDAQIRDEVDDALLYDPATESWEIDAAVKDGTVILDGEVDSWQEKQLAERVVLGVRGVKSIQNDIDVDYQVDRSDTEIREEVRRVLAWDVRVDDALIDVAVENEKVTLTGVVGSAAEKAQAIRDAWVYGADEIDASGLKIESWARDDRFRKDKYVDKPDSRIREAVVAALQYDPRVDAIDLTVEVDDGTVTLRGWTDNLKAKRSAANTARNTVGVYRVDNRLKVRPEQQVTDLKITKDVRAALTRDTDVNRFEITVSVVDGVVYLDGNVDTFFEKAQADQVAAGIKGVVAVENNLKVKRAFDALVYDPYAIPNWRFYDFDWFAVPGDRKPSKADVDVREDIQSQLFWSPFVDSDDVSVSVVDGVARLTGTVDTMAERDAAVENAYEGGALYVDNDLLVRNIPERFRNRQKQND